MHLDPDLLFLYKTYLRLLLLYQKLRRGYFALTPHFAPPTRQRTILVILQALTGMTIVLVIALVGATLGRVELLLIIPIYSILIMFILAWRQQTLNLAS